MSITPGHLPKLIICLFLNSVLPAYAQSEGEQVSSAPELQLGQAAALLLPVAAWAEESQQRTAPKLLFIEDPIFPA
ncbi:MAG: hypothetical protein IH912_03615, partial [Proteobacteria bacterium]|nr:hypothetical protein [Pseudomonadota bacterium]